MSRKPWDLAFTAEPEGVGALRRIVRFRLELWGLRHISDQAQLCVSELVSNVINHVGAGTPATLKVSMSGTRVRIEVHDPDTRALPTLLETAPDAESGRGMALVGAISDRWGVQLQADRKVTWCELPTALPSAQTRAAVARVNRVEAVIDAMVDVLYWLRAHARDPDEALDHVQNRFESGTEDAQVTRSRQEAGDSGHRRH